jgi:hypothetical protein
VDFSFWMVSEMAEPEAILMQRAPLELPGKCTGIAATAEV